MSELLTPEERRECYRETYKKALEWSEKYEVSLSAKHWNPDRPADRERYFIVQYIDWIMKEVAQAQRDRIVAWLWTNGYVTYSGFPYEQDKKQWSILFKDWETLRGEV